MAAVAGGEVGSIDSVGEIYCRLLGACERATDVTRAERWMAAARRFVAWGDFVPPTCRLHYGGILIAVGRWQEAEEELLGAARVFEDGYRGMRAAPLIRLAELGTYTEGVGRRTRRSSRQSSSNERSASMSSDQIQSLQPIAVRSDEGEARWWMGSLALVLATAEDTGGQMTIIEVTEPREKRPCTCTTSRTRPSTCSRGA